MIRMCGLCSLDCVATCLLSQDRFERSVSLHSSGMNPMIAGATALSHHNLRV